MRRHKPAKRVSAVGCADEIKDRGVPIRDVGYKS